jgi:tRNA uridine 5-carboxymethylaminomethyl modification enzyme
MMTSRAEFRLVLREDNTIERLAQVGFDCGLLSREDFDRLNTLVQRRQDLLRGLESLTLVPNASTLEKLRELNTSVILKPTSGADLLRRDEISCLGLRSFGLDVPEDENIFGPVEIHVKYSGYIHRQNEMILQARKLEDLKLSESLDYSEIRGLSREEVEKLNRLKPASLGQAQRISGVNPSAIQAIMVHLKGRERRLSESTNITLV